MNRALRRTVMALVALAGAACAPSDRIVAPVAVPRLDVAAMKAALAGPQVSVAIPKELRDIGCVMVGRDSEGVSQAASVSRHLVADLIGQLDSIKAPVVAGRPTAGSLHVVTGVLALRSSTSYTINCLAPNSVSQARFTEELASTPRTALWSAIFARMQPRTGDSSKPDVVIASEILLAPIRTGAPPKRAIRSSDVRNGLISPAVRPSYAYWFWVCGAGTDIACGTARIQRVTVTARSGWPVVVDLSELYGGRRIYSLSELQSVDYYDGPDCSNASDTWLALEANIMAMEEVAGEMEIATNAVANQTCEADLTGGGRDLCIDLFIMSERAAFFVGDNREFDRYAPWSASRAQLYINPVTCVVGPHVNTTRTVGFGPFEGGARGPHALNRVTATPSAEGCVVEWSLNNGFCATNELAQIICPSIDGRLVLRSDGSGGWTGSINEDKYPARGIYLWSGGDWRVIDERRQSTLFDLYGWRKHIEDLRISRNTCMPEGCNVQ